eukprot:387493-Pyramimonas_sp.AAC.1
MDDGRFLCPQLHWVRTGFGRCPHCTNAAKYTYMVAHNYLLQSYKSQIIENSLRNNGFELTVHEFDKLPHRQEQYILARRLRQGKASADVMSNSNASLKVERKWANGACTAMAAAG